MDRQRRPVGKSGAVHEAPCREFDRGEGPLAYKAKLPVPETRRPFFGEEGMTEALKQLRESYYEDAFVLAFPSPAAGRRIEDSDEKALYYRAPYTSQPGVKQYLPAPAQYPDTPDGSAIKKDAVVDLTSRLRPDGTIEWDVPAGEWTIMRFGVRNNGAITRPAPFPGLGLESDKFSAADFDSHFNAYIGKLIGKTGPRATGSGGGWTMLHMDSWEMGAQNWTKGFREEFRRRRGYDPLPFFPAYTGLIVGSLETSERFLWDVRITAQELVIEHHAERIKTLGRKYGFGLSIEPYDMNPCADLDLGLVADVPMCEFWSKDYGFNSAFSCVEAASIAHVNGKSVVAAEAFTADAPEAFRQYPGSMKNQGDWAFSTGVNRFVYHTFAHKPLGDQYRPGMTMGPYGVHWDRGQTWWPMASSYHRYVSRCSYLLQQGRTVADVLYLAPEGAPHVFRPPVSALAENDTIPDRRGFNFGRVFAAHADREGRWRDHRIVFPGGASYRLLVLPAVETMTPELLEKVGTLVRDGATVAGMPPLKSPSLVGYPACDTKVRTRAEALWGGMTPPKTAAERRYGKGSIYWGGELSAHDPAELYPNYAATTRAAAPSGGRRRLSKRTAGPLHHRTNGWGGCIFCRQPGESDVAGGLHLPRREGAPELWDPLTGETRRLPEFIREQGGRIRIPMRFEPYQSFFVVFAHDTRSAPKNAAGTRNFPDMAADAAVEGPWTVSFDPKWGGPETAAFAKLEDWTKRPEDGIRHYSGIAVYRTSFDLPYAPGGGGNGDLYLDLGEVWNMARIRLNGEDMGVVWTAPWRVNISKAVKKQGNRLEIEVTNLWPNRLIGDERLPDDGIRDGRWPEWLMEKKPRTSGRFTFVTHRHYTKDSPL